MKCFGRISTHCDGIGGKIYNQKNQMMAAAAAAAAASHCASDFTSP